MGIKEIMYQQLSLVLVGSTLPGFTLPNSLPSHAAGRLADRGLAPGNAAARQLEIDNGTE